MYCIKTTFYFLHPLVYSIQSIDYSIYSIVKILYFAIYSIPYQFYIIQTAIWNKQSIIYSLQSTLSRLQFKLNKIWWHLEFHSYQQPEVGTYKTYSVNRWLAEGWGGGHREDTKIRQLDASKIQISMISLSVMFNTIVWCRCRMLVGQKVMSQGCLSVLWASVGHASSGEHWLHVWQIRGHGLVHG